MVPFRMGPAPNDGVYISTPGCWTSAFLLCSSLRIYDIYLDFKLSFQHDPLLKFWQVKESILYFPTKTVYLDFTLSQLSILFWLRVSQAQAEGGGIQRWDNQANQPNTANQRGDRCSRGRITSLKYEMSECWKAVGKMSQQLGLWNSTI